MAIAPPTVAIPRWQRWSPAEERRPGSAVIRWLLRVLLALPFVGLALHAAHQGYVAPGPALAAGLVTGIVLGALGERLLAWQVPIRLVVPFVFVPALAFQGSQDPAAMVTLACLALAVEGFVHFAVAGRPEGAVRVGLALGVAALFDPMAIGYAAAFAIAAPYVAAERRRPGPPSWAVLLFPAVALFLGRIVLEWRLTGQVGLSLDSAGLGGAVGGALVAVAHTPLYAAVGVIYAFRRPRALIGYLVPALCVFATLLIGLPYSAVSAYLLLTLVALVAVPRAPSRRLGVFLGTVALLQWAQALTWPPTSPAFAEWLRVAWGF
ncbi:hypothetical protein [Asanoa siamensis]|uniref:Uncharacterized protein n=1 Tax=Asanoa siamensis TaxID=926357 RepID=A0ABQ4CL42_9ACTN|nr:hypothetical protein [Asanoa siamensis]GIF72032.1 hypothetical protein Asi02nite_15500 [Asanoa siamensis]